MSECRRARFYREFEMILLGTRKQLVRVRTKEIIADMRPRCDRGGCEFHSGHEFCSMDAAWDHAESMAQDEAWEFECIFTDADGAA